MSVIAELRREHLRGVPANGGASVALSAEVDGFVARYPPPVSR